MKKRMIAFLCALALILPMIPASAPTVEAATPGETMYVGYGIVNVTPQASVPLGGYGKTSDRMSEYNADDVANSHLLDDNGDGVVDAKDGVYATCIAIKDSDGEILIFFGMDFIGSNSDWVNAARTGIVDALAGQGITVKASNIMVNVSHTHSSPDMSSAETVIDTFRETILVPGMVAAAEQAVADFMPVTDISKVTVQTENMNFVRHYAYYKDSTYTGEPVGYVGDNYSTGSTSSRYVKPVSQADPNIYMLKFERESGKPVVMANWTAHPKCNSTGDTAWGKINRLKVSSDYVGTFRTDLANAGYLVAFFQGAAGNINTFSKLYTWSHGAISDPTNSATTQYVSGTNKNENYNGGTVSGTCQTGVLYGRVLADYALEGLTASANSATVTLESLTGGKIDAQQRMFNATVDRGDPEVYAAIMQTMPGSTQTYYDYLYNNWDSSHTLVKQYDINSVYHLSAIKRRAELAYDAYELELNAIRIGEDISFVTAPNELFDTYCTDLRDQGTFVFGYSNNSMGYLPDVNGIEKYKCYEANTTNYVAGTGEAVAKTLQEMMMTPEELGLGSTCHLCGASNVQWEVLNGTDNKGEYCEGKTITQVTSGHYYMLHDMKALTTTWQKTFKGNVCLDMRGHTIEATSGTTGRTVRVAANANLNIANGTLIGRGIATANNGDGGVVFIDSDATMTARNMTIQRKVVDGQSAVNGGAVYVNGTLNLLSSTVTGGVATTQGGGIYVTATGKLTLGGNTAVTGNTLSDETENNIYLEKASTAGRNFQLLAGYSGVTGVTLPARTDGVVFGTYLDPGMPAGYVGFDGIHDSVNYVSGNLTIGSTCPYCGQENVTWQEFPASASGSVLNIASGHYYLADDRTGSGNYRRQIQGDVCLNMNGHTFANESAKTGTAFYVNNGATFNVFGGGTIQGQGYLSNDTTAADSLYRGGVIRVDKGGTANLHGITVQRAVKSTQSAKWGGVIYVAGNLTLNGATVKGGVATVAGDGIYVDSTGSLTLSGVTSVEKNIYLNNADQTNGTFLNLADSYTGAATVELASYTDGATFGTCGSHTGTVTLDTDKAVYNVSDGNMVLDVLENVCLIVYADGSESEPYDSVADALSVYEYSADSPSYIKLLDDIVNTVTVSETVYLDTNSFDITVAVSGEGKLYGMENATDDFAVGTDDLGKVTVESGAVVNTADDAVNNATDITVNNERYRYLPLEESEGVFTYHRFEMNTKKGLRPYNKDYGTALYYQPFFTTDEAVAAVINDTAKSAAFGVIATIDKEGTDAIEVSMEAYGLTYDDAVRNGEYRVVIPDLMPSNSELGSGTKTIATHDLSASDVTGRAYIVLTTAEGGAYYIYDDADAHISLREAILKTDSDAVYDTLNKTQKDALNTMYSRYSKTINSWGKDLLNNIGNIKIDISDWFN